MHDKPSTLTAADVNAQLDGLVDYILDGGACPGGVESTVIDVTVEPPAIVRKGIMKEKEILALIKRGY